MTQHDSSIENLCGKFFFSSYWIDGMVHRDREREIYSPWNIASLYNLNCRDYELKCYNFAFKNVCCPR